MTTTVTPELLELAYGKAQRGVRFDVYAPLLTEVAQTYQLNTAQRLAAFLAQIGHESGRLLYVREIWGPTEVQKGYEGRLDLGNTQPGDGFRFRGHGLIQVTGRANHAAMTVRLRKRFPDLKVPDFVATPDALSLPMWACMSSGEFWDSRNLNALADIGDQRRITKKVNGGYNGLADRLALYSSALGACLLNGV